MLIDSVMFSHAALDLTTHVKQKENTPQCPWWRSQSNLSNYIGNISRAFKRHHLPNCRFFFLRSNKVKEIVRNQPSLKQSAEWINKVTYLDIEDVSSFQVQCPALNWRRFLLLLFNTLKILFIGQLAETFRQKRRIFNRMVWITFMLESLFYSRMKTTGKAVLHVSPILEMKNKISDSNFLLDNNSQWSIQKTKKQLSWFRKWPCVQETCHFYSIVLWYTLMTWTGEGGNGRFPSTSESKKCWEEAGMRDLHF